MLFLGVEGLGDPLCSDATLFTASNFVAARGGGKGDMESPEMDALWAWYTRIGFSDGTDSTCYRTQSAFTGSSGVVGAYYVPIVSANDLERCQSHSRARKLAEAGLPFYRLQPGTRL